MQTLEPINEKALLEKYISKEYDQLSEFFISVLEHFEQVIYLELSSKLEQTINIFLKHLRTHFFVKRNHSPVFKEIISDRSKIGACCLIRV